jgi:primary-amine oxidase
MIEDTQTVAGYTILRDEPNDPAPDLSSSQHLHPLGMFPTLHI